MCHQNGSPSSLLICGGCGGRPYHKHCWDQWPDHRPGALVAYEPCGKTEFEDFVWIHWLLHSNISPEKQEKLHMDDIWTTWFGVPHYQSLPRLDIYPRLKSLLEKSAAISPFPVPTRQYPSLISFFGDTGGGKSSLIRALIRNAAPTRREFEVPVPGNQAERHRSTSGDVHLYGDPETLHTKVPIFYAGKLPHH